MEELKEEIIVIESKDFNDKDKIITFFSLQSGLGTAKVRGVKGAQAKLKFLASSFCHAEVIFFKSGESLIVKTATANETFFNLASDYDKYEVGYSILEVLKNCVYYGEPNPMIFILTLKSLYELCFNENIIANVILIKFMIELLKLTGYNTSFKDCNLCGEPLHKAFLNLDTADITCEQCKCGGALVINQKSLMLLDKISEQKIVKLVELEINQDEAKTLKSILKKLFTIKFSKEFKSF